MESGQNSPFGYNGNIVFKTDDLVDMKGFHIKFNSKNKNLLPKKNSDTDAFSTITWWIEELVFQFLSMTNKTPTFVFSVFQQHTNQ